MLLPILIFPPDVKKNLDPREQLDAINPELSGWICAFRCFLSSMATITSQIYYQLKSFYPNMNENFTSKYAYAFADQKPKTPQVCQHMTQEVDRQVLLQQLKLDYQQILINYFTTDKTLKERIDKFINAVFCANIPVPQIIEIHMELIDEFSTQLQLEGRSDETLLDYRLTLIDILAHLCEAYRCAIFK
ncbi:circadian clock protein KaiA [Nostoc sp. UHCC 0870]|uniref:circadian clock protein KaiA n=1 Tax=Nostoc sp. UHCC 0870 TaxID=2914041 RepID=UPI001EDD1CF1|nr:circadian clock protein KaiA [Nostoc sp. UHCC 0870]UKO97919.1 circadian clock protein KaiA [Nostoc sp. UHCC 0870]